MKFKTNFNLKKNGILDFIIVFGITLQAFYFYQIKLAPLPLISVLILIFDKNRISKSEIYYFFVLLAFILISIFIGFFNTITKGNIIYFNSVIGVLIGVLAFILFRNRFKNRKESLVKIIEIVLWVHAIAFLIQAIGFYGFGLEIDYVKPITNEESRGAGQGVLSSVIRPTGLTTEPAGYCIYMLMLVYIRLIISKSLKLIDYIIFLTCLISFSMTGIMLSGVMIVFKYIFYTKSKKELIVVPILTIGVLLVTAFFFYDAYSEYYDERFLNLSEDTSAEERWKNGTILFLSEPLFINIFGLGIGNYPYVKNHGITSAGSGLQSIFTSWGFLLTFCFMVLNGFFFIKSKVKIQNILLWFIIMLGGQTITLVSFWILLSSLWLSGNDKPNIIKTK